AGALGRFYMRNARELEWFERSPGAAAETAEAAPGGPTAADAGWHPDVVGSAAARQDVGELKGNAKQLEKLFAAWEAFRALPKWVDVTVAAVGLLLMILAVRAEMAGWRIDAVAGENLGKLNRMSYDMREAITNDLRKLYGIDVGPDEIQLLIADPNEGK